MGERAMKKQGVMQVICAALAVFCMQASLSGQTESYSLMVQQSPADAGFVSPPSGVHRIQIGDQVVVQAAAHPGYRFLYWLGDVSDSSTDQSVVVIDAPKIVIAVFGRAEYDIVPAEAKGGGGGGGGDGPDAGVLTPSAVHGVGSLGSSGPGRAPASGRRPQIIPPPNGDDEVPVPGDGIPVPGGPEVPEPATLVLLGLGAIVLLRRKPR